MYLQWLNGRLIGNHGLSNCTNASDLKGHSLVVGLFKCDFSTTCAAFYKISIDSVFAQFL